MEKKNELLLDNSDEDIIVIIEITIGYYLQIIYW
tara:strand:+ start:41 stop:142 length:102 start_codon:yes stop_codon:yes gene_type:complete